MTVWHYCHLQRLHVDLDMIQITVDSVGLGTIQFDGVGIRHNLI